MDSLDLIFTANNFKFEHETSKARCFKNGLYSQYIYLLPSKRKISVVLHPDFVEKQEYILKKSVKKRYSSAFIKFPKEIRTGKTLMNYGYLFAFQTTSELSEFLAEINEL